MAQDADFGAIRDAYCYKWIGAGFVNPTPSLGSVTRALRWALQSTTEQAPVLNLIIVPVLNHQGKPDRVEGLLRSGRTHVLCTLQQDTLGPHRRQYWHNFAPAVQQIRSSVRLVLVYNDTGLASVDSHGLETLRASLVAAGATVTDWSPAPPGGVNALAGPSLSANFKAAARPPQAVQRPLGWQPGARLDDAQLQRHFQGLRRPIPDERFAHPHRLVYTDGSKVGSSITAGVYQEASLIEESFKVVGHEPQLNTVLRAELAAIHRALDALRSRDFQHDTCVLTDSQTAIYLIDRALHRPESLRVHKHRDLLFTISQRLLAHPRGIQLLKVRAHTGVLGNEKADSLASLAHGSTAGSNSFGAAGHPGRGLYWVKYNVSLPGQLDAQVHNANDLDHDLLRVATEAHANKVFEAPKSSVIQKVSHLLQTNGGIQVQPSTAIWSPGKLTSRETRLATLVRAQRVWTRSRQQRCLGAERIPDTTCPVCLQAPETVMHALNACSQGAVLKLIKLRHDQALRKIEAAVLDGQHRHLVLTCDARNVPRSKHPLAQHLSRIPAWALPPGYNPSSVPDLCLISVESKPGAVALTRRQRTTGWIKIVEVKYAPDLEIHGAARDQASEQHLTLAKDLRDYGWGLVEIYPFVVGNAGTIPTDGDVALQALGVSAADRLTLL